MVSVAFWPLEPHEGTDYSYEAVRWDLCSGLVAGLDDLEEVVYCEGCLLNYSGLVLEACRPQVLVEEFPSFVARACTTLCTM